MQSGIATEYIQAVPDQQPQPINKDPQPKSKKEEIGPLVDIMLQTLGCLNQLQIQAHLIHFNYEAPNFLAVHKQLKKQYELHLKQFDKLGEQIRSLDYMTVMCNKGLISCYKKFEHCNSYDPIDMLCIYIKNLENAGMLAKKMNDVACRHKAPDVGHYAAELVGEMFESAWLFKATLRRM